MQATELAEPPSLRAMRRLPTVAIQRQKIDGRSEPHMSLGGSVYAIVRTRCREAFVMIPYMLNS